MFHLYIHIIPSIPPSFPQLLSTMHAGRRHILYIYVCVAGLNVFHVVCIFISMPLTKLYIGGQAASRKKY